MWSDVTLFYTGNLKLQDWLHNNPVEGKSLQVNPECLANVQKSAEIVGIWAWWGKESAYTAFKVNGEC